MIFLGDVRIKRLSRSSSKTRKSRDSMVLRECCGLEVERETELQVEVERMLVTDCVEWHGCDVMRELGCDVDAHIASEVILRSRSCVNRPLQSLD